MTLVKRALLGSLAPLVLQAHAALQALKGNRVRWETKAPLVWTGLLVDP